MTGKAADKLGKKSEAAELYSRLADAKISGTGMEDIYYYVVSQAYIDKDMQAFNKYLRLGAEVFPTCYYFKFDVVDFAAGHNKKFNKRLYAYENLQKKQPHNFRINLALGRLIYDTLYSTIEGAVLPKGAAAMEKKMVNALNRAAAIAVNDAEPHILLSGHYYKKALRLRNLDTKPSTEYVITLQKARKPTMQLLLMLALKKPAEDYYERSHNRFEAKKACLNLLNIHNRLKTVDEANGNDTSNTNLKIEILNNVWNSIKYL